MTNWNRIFERVAEEYRPLFEALRAYDKGASEEEIRKILGLEEL